MHKVRRLPFVKPTESECCRAGAPAEADFSVKYVYIPRSVADEEHCYTGITDDLKARLSKHNSGEVTHTAKYRPWRLKSYIAFANEARAFAFEKYLKSGSGRAFAKARL
jgi:putative endonuclease